MPRVLVLEPGAEDRTLFCHMVTRLGHAPVVVEAVSGTRPACEVILLEPAWPAGADLARELLREQPWLPVIAASVYPRRGHEFAGIPVRWHLVKPFPLAQLGYAITEACPQPRPLMI